MNLIHALVATPRSMTKRQVRASVAGYAGSNDDAFERMFERDKDALRELGMPLLTVPGSGPADEIGYRIDTEAYALGEVTFTAAELGAVSLATQLWRDHAVSEDSARALAKLVPAADPAAPGSADLAVGLAPRLQPAGDSLVPLLEAVATRTVVSFTYRTAWSGAVGERTVEPWAVLGRGGWYLVGHDLDRDAPRVFRLSRIESEVREVGEPGAFAAVPPDRYRAAFDAHDEADPVVATLAVRPERAASLRARALEATDPRAVAAKEVADLSLLGDRDLVQVELGGLWDGAQEVAGYGEAALVLGPADLRACVIDLLRAAARLDAGGDEPSPGTEGTEAGRG